MKRTMIALTASTLSLTSLLVAQTPANQPTSENVVTMSFNSVVLGTAEAKKELSTLQTKFAPRKAHLQALNVEIEAMRKQLSSTSDKLNDSERNLREQSINSKEKQLQREAEDFRNDTQSESQQVFQGIAQKIYTFLQSYSQQHGYSVVIERGSDAAPVVWYAANNMDITDQLIKAYDAQASTAAPGSMTH
jgi:Skp family chaperone for outer membrane proteins